MFLRLDKYPGVDENDLSTLSENALVCVLVELEDD